MYDFPLVINTNLPPILHRLRDIAFDKPKSLYLATLLRLISPGPDGWGSLQHIIVNDIPLKLDALGYISVAESLGIYFQPLLRSAPRRLPNSLK